MPRRARIALVGAAALVGLLLITWYAAFHVAVLQRADVSIYNGFVDLSSRRHVTGAATFIARLCNPEPYVFLCGVPVVVALLRRRWDLAVAIVVILLGANATRHLLKPLVAEPRPQPGPAWWLPGSGSWPSGHATAAMALALCLVLASPAGVRPFAAAAGAGFAVAVCYSFLALGWHYPSDALGGLLVATLWTLLAVAALDAVRARGRRAETSPAAVPPRRALAPAAIALAGALLVAALVLAARPPQVLSYAGAHRAFVAGAAVLGGLALALATGVMMVIPR
jgi:membrane-associated phospholipid phosphatase